MRSIIYIFFLLFLLSACSSDSKSAKTSISEKDKAVVETGLSSSNLAIPDNRFASHYQILMFGNSHTAGLDSLIKLLLHASNENLTVNIVNAGGGFLDNQSSQQRRLTLLESQPWTHLILQGQKYSQSGAYDYSTASTKAWINTAKSLNITPILFPEHPQKGNTEEGKRIHALHTSIAATQRACVAPVGLTWDKVMMTEPTINLHHDDGNHASLTGRLLTAFIFYEVITGQSAELLPVLNSNEVDGATQQLLKQLASTTIQTNLPCTFENE
ncbi:hypothetical protein [Thalassotalea castellviae]|uniref:SGNH/GDSL hydrolase family protein n=1 Tax=Thalassotalea castellviae TaxID=3075612 RepID=A0ABU2ZWK9_9GAMM|nr:hypothetical protein [Thalassotalea sp. W431]MDT0602317.1 hypothetical protein [Thalassotalea sp. W431]